MKRLPLKTVLRAHPPEQWASKARSFRDDPRLTEEYFGRPFPTRLEHFTFHEDPSTPNLRVEVEWATASVIAHQAEIAHFVQFRGVYERALLSANFNLALEALKKIEDRLGLSFWLIEAYLSTFFERRDEKAADDFFQRLMAGVNVQISEKKASKRSKVPLTAGVSIAFALVKTFPLDAGLIKNLTQSFLTQLARSGESPQAREYFRYRAGEWLQEPPTLTRIGLVLNYERKLPLVDRYVSLLKGFEWCLAVGSQESAVGVESCVTQLKELNDPVLRRLDTAQHLAISTSPNDTPFKEYIDGQYGKAASSLRSQISSDEVHASAVKLMISQIMGADPKFTELHLAPTLGDQLMRAHRSLVARGDNVAEGRKLLELFVRRHASFSEAGLFASRLHDASMLLRATTEPSAWGKVYYQYLPVHDPLRIRYAPLWQFESLSLEALSNTSWAYVDYAIRAKHKVDPSLVAATFGETDYGAWTLACWLAASARLQEALVLLNSLTMAENKVIRYRAAILRIRLTLDLARHKEFLDYAIELLELNPNCAPDIDWDRYFALFGQSIPTADTNVEPIRVAYLYALYDRHVGFESPLRVVNVLEDAFDHFEIDSPELFPEEAFITLQERVLFLETVCIPRYLEGNSYFESSNAVYSARVKVLELLAQLSPTGSLGYMVELRKIREDELVAKCLRDFRSSLLFVPENSIKQRYEATASERLQAIKQRPKLSPEVITVYDKKSESKAEDFTGNVDALLLVQPYREFRDIYVVDKRFGLNTIINSRLRHGVVPNMLLRPISDFGLSADQVSQRLTAASVDIDRIRLMGDIIARVVKEYSANVRRFASEYLKVKLEPNDVGMFDFSTDAASITTLKHITILGESIDERTTTADFLQMLAVQMRDRLELGAASIRKYLLGDFYSHTEGLFQHAAGALQSIRHREAELLRGRVLSAKQGALECIKTAATWCEPGDEKFVAPLDMGTVMSAAYKAARETLGSARLQVDTEVKATRRLRHICIRPMFQLITILLENAVTHSGEISVTVRFSVVEEGDSLRIVSTSSCAEMTEEVLAVRREEIKQHIANIRAKVEEVADQDRRSGIAKVIKLITSDMAADVEYDIDYKSTTSFGVALVIKADHVLV